MAAKDLVSVRLQRDFFGPGGSLYRAVDSPHEFPADYAEPPRQKEGESDEAFAARKARQKYEVLPSTATVEGIVEVPEEKPAPNKKK